MLFCSSGAYAEAAEAGSLHNRPAECTPAKSQCVTEVMYTNAAPITVAQTIGRRILIVPFSVRLHTRPGPAARYPLFPPTYLCRNRHTFVSLRAAFGGSAAPSPRSPGRFPAASPAPPAALPGKPPV